MTKTKKLKTKSKIGSSYQQQFTDYLRSISLNNPKFHTMLTDRLAGYYSEDSSCLLDINDIHNKLWFVNTGLLVCLLTDAKKIRTTMVIYSANELAMITESLSNRPDAICSLMACPGTNILEINKSDFDGKYGEFPEINTLINKGREIQNEKLVERVTLCALTGEEKIAKFYEIYPDVKGRNRKIKLMDKYQASYLDLTSSSFSRLLKKMEKSEM